MILGVIFCIPMSHTAYAMTIGKWGIQQVGCYTDAVNALNPTRDLREVQKYVEQGGKPYKECLSKVDARKSSIDVYKEFKARK